MPKSDIEIDSSVFEQKARLLAKKLGKSEREFIKNQTGLLAREVAKMTPPYAGKPTWPTNTAAVGSAKDIKAGKGAIIKDLLKICKTQKSPDIKKLWKRHGAGPVMINGIQIAAGIIMNESELRTWHRKNQSARLRTKQLPRTSQMYVATVVFNRYAKQQQRYVGRAKAVFYGAALTLGAKVSAPPNVKMNMLSVYSYGRVKGVSGKTVGEIGGRAGGLFHTIRHIPMLKKNRLIKAVKRGEYVMRKAAKDSNFKVV